MSNLESNFKRKVFVSNLNRVSFHVKPRVEYYAFESNRVSNCVGKDYESNHVSFKRKVILSNFKLKIMRQNLRSKFNARFDVKTFHLEFAMSAQKALQGSETETRELLLELQISPMRGH